MGGICVCDFTFLVQKQRVRGNGAAGKWGKSVSSCCRCSFYFPWAKQKKEGRKTLIHCCFAATLSPLSPWINITAFPAVIFHLLHTFYSVLVSWISSVESLKLWEKPSQDYFLHIFAFLATANVEQDWKGHAVSKRDKSSKNQLFSQDTMCLLLGDKF